MSNPNCFSCIHFFITLDETHPRGCKVFNMKGRAIPSVDVKRFTGHSCPAYEEREKVKKKIIMGNNILDTFA